MRLSLDIGGTFIKCAFVTDDGRILEASSFPTDSGIGSIRFVEDIVEKTSVFLRIWEAEHGHTTFVGAGMAGFTDGRKGIVYQSPNLPGIWDLDLASGLSEGLNLPALIDNDATAAAWGEYLFGEHGDIRDMMVVTLGTGIGAGLILDGRLFRGAKGMAGELGQMAFMPDGPECQGGSMGCLEFYVGKSGLVNDYLTKSGLTEAVEPMIIHERAGQGDVDAIDAFEEYGHKLGIVLASSVNLLDLGLVVLTGGITGAWDYFGYSLVDSFRNNLVTPHKNSVTIQLSGLNGNAGILGAAFLDRVESI